MSINPSVKSAPYASIQDVSYVKTEEEILFSMRTIFRIGEITQPDNKKSLYQVDLTLTSDDDPELSTFTDRLRKEAGDATGWAGIGTLLMRAGNLKKAEEVYTLLCKEVLNDRGAADCYHNLGVIKYKQGDYEAAIEYCEKALEIQQKSLLSNDPSQAVTYTIIGEVYTNMGEYSKALAIFEKAREILEKTLPSDHPLLNTSYHNIGVTYERMGEYSKALSFLEKVLDTQQKTLRSNPLSWLLST